MKQIDLASLDTVSACNAGAEVQLKHPVTQAPLGIFITVLGKDSDAFRNHVRESINDDIRRAQMAKKRGKSDEVSTVEKGEARGIELLVVCTAGWRTVTEAGEVKTILLKGEQLPYSVVNAKKLYEAMPWIRNQVDEGIADLENFMPS